MVQCGVPLSQNRVGLSVLALSSRFDGRDEKEKLPSPLHSFSTRSVESF